MERREGAIIAGLLVAVGVLAVLLAVVVALLVAGRGGGGMAGMMMNGGMMNGGMMGGQPPALPADVTYATATPSPAAGASPAAAVSAPTATPAAPAAVSADIRDFVYQPSTIQLRTGGTVTWTNVDSVPHSATARSGGWDSGLLQKGQSWTRTFETAGEFYYYCSVHPSMYGKVIVNG